MTVQTLVSAATRIFVGTLLLNFVELAPSGELVTMEPRTVTASLDMEKLEIRPFVKGTEGCVLLPGSKSITNRALVFAALSSGDTVLKGLLKSEDTEFMLECLGQLGVGIEMVESENERALKITGVAGSFPVETADLYVGTAGTVARLLVGVLGVHKSGRYRVDGSEVMRKRPMKGLTDLLEQLGCEIEFEGEPGALPFVLKPHGFTLHEVDVDASASSQVLSAALMAAPQATGEVVVRLSKAGIRKPYVVMTARMMESFGVAGIHWNDAFTEFVVPANGGYRCLNGEYQIESDASAASYFLALPFVTNGKMSVSRFSPEGLQGDVGFADVLRKLGAHIAVINDVATVTFGEAPPYPQTFDFYPISDTFMTLAAVAPLLKKPLRIEGIAHTRKQESDRVHAVATELAKLGQEVDEGEDYLHIFPNRKNLIEVARQGVEIDTYKDHRIAMSFGVLGCCDLLGDQTPWMTIRDPMCCEKTYPDFFEELERLRNG